MSEDTLNEKLYETIFDNLDSFENHISGIEKAANECEKICIQSQIDLLTQIKVLYIFSNARYFEKEADELLQSLTNKLNQLK